MRHPASGVTLQALLGRRRAAGAAIAKLLGAMPKAVCILGPDRHALLGNPKGAPWTGGGDTTAQVVLEDQVLGFVSGPAGAVEPLAATLSYIAARESETKQLGAEVLNIYREINLIHKFSEQLSTILEPASVAEAAIQQASQLVKASAGMILLLNEISGVFELAASIPSDIAPVQTAISGEGLIGAIAAGGNAEMVNSVASDARVGPRDPPLCSMICVPLKMNDRVLGVLVLGSSVPLMYTAGDLKLLCTLGLQTATAIENASLHSKTLQVAKAEALEKTLAEVEEQKRRAESMLLNILPASVALELQQNGIVQPMYFEDVTVCFTDFVGFSNSTTVMAAEEVVHELHRYFTAFDRIIERYGLEKLKTIGDSYMFVGGLPKRRPSNPIDAVLAALEIVETVRNIGCSESGISWPVRVGLHTGPVIAGVVGIHKFAFDIWGETVNLASRMESCSEANRVNISERTYVRVKDFVASEPRGRIKTKDGQELEMYFVRGLVETLLKDCSTCPPPLFDRRYQTYFKEAARSFPAHLIAPVQQELDKSPAI